MVTPAATLTLRLRRGTLVKDPNGYATWHVEERPAAFSADETALLLCDVWDRHWCRGANERLAAMLPRMNAVARALRDAGILIVHAPSDTMDFYRDHPARRRVLAAPPVQPPAELPREDPPLPIQAPGGGSDTNDDVAPGGAAVWTRQHPAIEIDGDRDAISDDGGELLALYRQRGIRNILIMGVHTNMCVLGRSFAIKQMVRWGFRVALVRDLTDTMYTPADAPYVPHADGTGLVIEYIEKFWCPSVDSADLLAPNGERPHQVK